MMRDSTRTSISRSNLPKQITDHLRQRIMLGEFAEGCLLRQDIIAAEYGVSRMPVREALRYLEAEGLIVFYPYRGAVVSSLTIDDVQEIFELRILIECDLLRIAMKNLTSEHLARAAEILRAFDAAAQSPEPVDAAELNWQFHSALYEAAERPITMGYLKRLHGSAARYPELQKLLAAGILHATKEHRQLLTLCKKGDTIAALQLLRNHILTAVGNLRTAIILQSKEQ